MPRRVGHSMLRHFGDFGIGIACSLVVVWSSASAQTAPAQGQIFASEFSSDPVSEGWTLVARYCGPLTWNDRGWYFQKFPSETCLPGQDVYRRSLEPFVGIDFFFAEFRVGTDGSRSEISYGGPIVLSLHDTAGVLYHMTVSTDLVQFLRDVDLPIWFIEIDPTVPHTYRIELDANRYAFYIDSFLIGQGIPEGPFPAFESPRITWQGQSMYLPCENAWDYIRFGRTPEDGSGDFDSDAVVDLSDFYFVQECVTNQRPGINGGPDEIAGPGCRFADFDGDGDVDLLDFAEFQNSFGT